MALPHCAVVSSVSSMCSMNHGYLPPSFLLCLALLDGMRGGYWR